MKVYFYRFFFKKNKFKLQTATNLYQIHNYGFKICAMGKFYGVSFAKEINRICESEIVLPYKLSKTQIKKLKKLLPKRR